MVFPPCALWKGGVETLFACPLLKRKVKRGNEKSAVLSTVSFKGIVAFFLLLFALSVQAWGAVSVNRNAIAAAQWMEHVEDSMSRARTFYRMVEAMGKKEKEEESPVLFFYHNRKSLREIRDALPTLFTKDQFAIFMPDWPALEPVSWMWIEPSKDGIIVFEAGDEGGFDKNEMLKNMEPIWMVDVELALPTSEIMETPFFQTAIGHITSISPSVRYDGSRLIFTIFPSASMVRDLLEKTYWMKSVSM